MQIKIVEERKTWEDFILKTSPQSFFQSWDWGEIVKKTNDSKNKFLGRFGIYDKNKNLTSIFQVTKITAKRGNYLHLRHGPVIAYSNLSDLKYLKEFLINLSKIEKTSFIRISPLLDNNPEIKRAFIKEGFRDSPLHRLDGEYCWVLDLDKSEEELLQNMRKTTRYLIKWAIKNKVKIVKSKNPEDIDKFMQLYELTATRHNFVKHRSIKEEFEILLNEKKAVLFMGFHDTNLLSSALIIFYGNQGIYHHSASVQQKIPVNYLLQWHAILEAKNKNMKIYNFWGISTPGDKGHPWYNLSQFKMGFGGRVVEYLHSMDLPVNRISYLKTYAVETARKISKGF